MAERAFFYFRDPKYIASIPDEKKADFLSEDPASTKKQITLKNLIRTTCLDKNIPLYENYHDPKSLVSIIKEQLKDTIDKQFPKESIPDPLTREAEDQEAYAEIRRRTYIGRHDYFVTLDLHCNGTGKPLLLLGESGSGKSSLIANWVEHWRKEHPNDFIFQHYIGSTADSTVHWKLMTRLMSEIKRWSKDEAELPRENDDMLRDFPLWLSKARIKADRDGVKFIIILDALNQLEDKDYSRNLGWLPADSFKNNLRLIISTLPGDTFEALEERSLTLLHIEPLTQGERSRMIIEYLRRFSKSLDKPRIDRLSNATPAANPLYLKILLDELRTTGTHEKLDERLDDYLKAENIPALLQKVLARYQNDYEYDHKGLVSDALGLIWSARRGLTEKELLQLLRPSNLPQLPFVTWSPLRAVLEESLVDRGGILNFAHDYLRFAVETAFVSDIEKTDDFRIRLADYFEAQPPSARNCDELPWLLWQTELFKRLRMCLINIDRFLEITDRDSTELRKYWISLEEEKNIGKSYINSFHNWKEINSDRRISFGAKQLGFFLFNLTHYHEAELLYQLSIKIDEESFGKNNPSVATSLGLLAQLFLDTNKLGEAESLMKRSLKINEEHFGKDDPKVALSLGFLSLLLSRTNQTKEAELMMRRALNIVEEKYGKDHPKVAGYLNNLSLLLKETNLLGDAESLMKRALKINEESLGKDHPDLAPCLNNLADLLMKNNKMKEAEFLLRRALKIEEESWGKDHPKVAIILGNLAQLLDETKRIKEAELLMRRALNIVEEKYGKDRPEVALHLNNLSRLLKANNRMDEAEELARRVCIILLNDSNLNKCPHPHLKAAVNNYMVLLYAMNWSSEQVMKQVVKLTTNIEQLILIKSVL